MASSGYFYSTGAWFAVAAFCNAIVICGLSHVSALTFSFHCTDAAQSMRAFHLYPTSSSSRLVNAVTGILF